MKFNLLATMSVMMAAIGVARADLTAGDLAIVGMNADTAEDFAWVALNDIAANTTIFFTDSSCGTTNGAGAYVDQFRWSETLNTAGSPFGWTHTSAIAAGTVVRYSEAGNAWNVGNVIGSQGDYSASGDQIFAYTGVIVSNSAGALGVANYFGDYSGADMLYGVTWANAGWLADGSGAAGQTTDSYVPAGLSVAANTAVYAGALDNMYYTGITTGTRAELLAAINDTANWTGSNSDVSTANWATEFTVIPVPEPGTLALLGLGMAGMWARRRQARG